MLEAMLMPGLDVDRMDASNSSSSSSSDHRHRHRNKDGPRGGAKGREYASAGFGNYTDGSQQQGLYDQARFNQSSFHSDSELHSGLFSSNHSSITTTSTPTIPTPTTTPRGSHTTISQQVNRTLTFENSFRNNGSDKGLRNPYYSYYDISNSNNNNNNNNVYGGGGEGSEYQQYDIVPFNTDQDSDTPHFDADFFPEPLSPVEAGQNGTIPNSLDAPVDPFPFTPWGSSPVHTHRDQHLINNTLDPFHLNPIFKPNITSYIDHSKVHSDYGTNISTIISSDYNSTFPGDLPAEDLYTWSILMMAPLVTFGIGGNTLVILAISLEKRLQNVTNYFLLSLAVTDLLVSLIVMPFSIINVFTGRWLFGLLLCDFFVTSDVLMCTSSILHLCTISLERYIGIRYPLWTKNKSKRIVLFKIVLVWTIALAITSPITVLGVIKEENVLFQGECVLNNEHFIIYGSIFAFYIPLAIMVLMYALTVRMLNKQARLCQSRRADDGEGQPMIRRSTSRRNWQSRRKYYGREPLKGTSSYCGSRLAESDIGTLPAFQQRYRPLGVSRHNTIPLCHHHNYHHQSDGSRWDESGGGGGCGGGAAGGKDGVTNGGGSSNSLHRGRSNNNTNNVTNNNINGDNSGSTSHGNNNIRRNRFSNQNGTGNVMFLGRKPNSEFSFCNGHQEEVTQDLPSDTQNHSSRLSSSSSSSSPTSSTNREPKRLRELVKKHHVAVKAANILLMKRENQGQNNQSSTPSSSTFASVRRDNSVRTEQKASKVLGVVFMIFVICWAPFFTVNIMTALCKSCNFEPTLITAFVWLGYVSSTLNPIIYTIFNNIFRITFIKLLCCRYRLLHRARRSSNMPGVRNGLLTCSAFCPAPGSATATLNANSATTFVDESQC